jgi:hypothetical protein
LALDAPIRCLSKPKSKRKFPLGMGHTELVDYLKRRLFNTVETQNINNAVAVIL